MDMQPSKTAEMYTYNKVTNPEVTALIALLDAQRVSLREADLNLHARDQSFHKARPPEVVIWPISAEEVSRVLKFANDARIAVTAWGAGTSLEGNPLAVYGGIVMDLTRMDKIVNVRAEDFQADVQPGVTRIELNKALARYGLFFPPDP